MRPPPDCRPSVGASAPKGTCRSLSPFGGSALISCLPIPWLCVCPRLSFGWIIRIASEYHQTPAQKVSRNIQLNGLHSPTQRCCLFGSSAAM
ncbi:unnamed protein product [Brassica oleracea]